MICSALPEYPDRVASLIVGYMVLAGALPPAWHSLCCMRLLFFLAGSGGFFQYNLPSRKNLKGSVPNNLHKSCQQKLSSCNWLFFRLPFIMSFTRQGRSVQFAISPCSTPREANALHRFRHGVITLHLLLDPSLPIDNERNNGKDGHGNSNNSSVVHNLYLSNPKWLLSVALPNAFEGF